MVILNITIYVNRLDAAIKYEYNNNKQMEPIKSYYTRELLQLGIKNKIKLTNGTLQTINNVCCLISEIGIECIRDLIRNISK